MNKYIPETLFQAAEKSRSSNGGVYNLRQDGYRNGKPNMVKDVTIQIHGHNFSKEEYAEIEKVIITALNERYTKPEITSIEFYRLYQFQRQRLQFKELRDGQLVFSLMYKLMPAQANKYTGTEIDPFNNDNVIDKFIIACFSQ